MPSIPKLPTLSFNDVLKMCRSRDTSMLMRGIMGDRLFNLFMALDCAQVESEITCIYLALQLMEKDGGFQGLENMYASILKEVILQRLELASIYSY